MLQFFQVIMEKTGLSLKRFKKVLIVDSLVFPILVTVTLIHKNSIFDLVDAFSKFNALGGRVTNATSHNLKGDVASAGEMKAENITGSEVGPNSHLFADLKNNPSLSTSIANDKLLDGLLASTFGEQTCLSRYQSHLLRKASPYKPSSHLKSKLRNYELLHRSCGPHTKFYETTTRKGLNSSNDNAATECKYLVWFASNGLENRMITLAAAFLYSILTDRVLLIKFGTDMVGLFCEPFPDSSWLLPKDFPYWKNQKLIETYQSFLKGDKENTSTDSLPSFLLLNLQHSRDGHEIFWCDHSQVVLQKVPVLILSSDQYFVPSLFMIPYFKQELSKMFPEKDRVFHHLGRNLFHPSNEAWELIIKFYQAYLADADERIGIQIRLFNPRRAPHQTILNEILSCTIKHKLVPEVNEQKSVISPSKNQKSKAVLVTSLYSEYGEKLGTMYSTNTSETSKVIEVYQPSHEEHQKKNDTMHLLKAWTEIYLLSLCDALITSPKSTFGYVAQSLGGLEPWILQRAYGEDVPNPPCRRAMSMDPCFHYPPKHDCRASNIVNVTSRFPHIRYCEDVSSGVKLVGDYNLVKSIDTNI